MLALKKNTIFVNILPFLLLKYGEGFCINSTASPWGQKSGSQQVGPLVKVQLRAGRTGVAEKKYRLPSHIELHINSASFSVLTMSQIVYWTY